MLGANTLIYLNQSSPALGCSLNYLTETTTNFQLRDPPSNLAISMDCSRATFVSTEQLLVALRGGEIYILTLVPEGLRGVKNILFEKAAAGVLPSCVSQSPMICVCSNIRTYLWPTHLGVSLKFSLTSLSFVGMQFWSWARVYWFQVGKFSPVGIHKEAFHGRYNLVCVILLMEWCVYFPPI